MRRTLSPSLFHWKLHTCAGLLVASSFAITGCAAQSESPNPNEPARSLPTSPTKDVTPTRLAQGESAIDAEAAAYAKRLEEALARKNGEKTGDATVKKPDGDGGIEWLNDQDLRTANPPKVDAITPAKPAPTKVDDQKSKVDEPAKTQATPATKPVANDVVKPSSDADREAILKLIRDRVKSSSDPAAAKAMSIAALALIDPSFKLDEKELEQLPPSQRELAKQFHELFSALGKQVKDGESIDRHALGDKLNAIVGEQPLEIKTVKLCDRVRGFGVYEELPGDTFLAGREQPLVVYVELDHFKSVKAGAVHHVKLTQELILFNESDGLAVWKQPEEQITDESRNQRRDFYVVQPTRLPARLGVGKYVLKIRVRDVQGGTRDEVSLPINMVADPALVKPDAKRSAPKPG